MQARASRARLLARERPLQASATFAARPCRRRAPQRSASGGQTPAVPCAALQCRAPVEKPGTAADHLHGLHRCSAPRPQLTLGRTACAPSERSSGGPLAARPAPAQPPPGLEGGK
eukprot:3140501-Alexandrium_andersonii.AAC.1